MSWTWPTVRPSHDGIELRAYRADDVDMVRDLATDPYVPLIGSLPAHADHAEALAYIERQQGRLAEGAGYSFAVVDAASDTALGGIGLWLRGWEQGRASIGYSVAPRARGRGVATRAIRAVTGFAFSSFPQLFRLEAVVEPTNHASRRSVEAAGFAGEGLLRSYMEIGGRRRDMVMHARVRGD